MLHEAGANRLIPLCGLQNCILFADRESLVGYGFDHSVVRFGRNSIPVHAGA
jgi:hypothetical protein